jgi:hypothetical protein
MKKILVSMIIFGLVVSALGAAVINSGTLNVYGRIGTGTISFTVTQTNTTRIDLANTAAIQPTGDGVVLGDWEFSAVNQGSTVDYTVTYSTTPLTSGTTTIPFEVIELNGTTVVPQTSNSTTFQAPIGSSTVERNIAVRLSSTLSGSEPAAENYNGLITIELTTST